MVNGHSIVKILAQILYVVSILISNSKGDDAICNMGTCVPVENCIEEKLYGFQNFCSFHPLKVCCSKPRDYFEQSPSSLACKSYSNKLCGEITQDPHVSDKNEYPYMVQVGRSYQKTGQVKFDCGGTLIHEKFVLTAAHCTSLVDNEIIYVRLGGYNRTDGLQIVVKNVTHYNKYQIRRYDIALLELKRPVKFNQDTMPACLPTTSGLEFSNFWGNYWNYSTKDDTLPTKLININFTQLNPTLCSDVFNKIENIFNICAGPSHGLAGVCNSGGSLSIPHQESCLGQVFGVVGSGYYCEAEGSRSVHARVFSYLKWIESIVWPSTK